MKQLASTNHKNRSPMKNMNDLKCPACDVYGNISPNTCTEYSVGRNGDTFGFTKVDPEGKKKCSVCQTIFIDDEEPQERVTYIVISISETNRDNLLISQLTRAGFSPLGGPVVRMRINNDGPHDSIRSHSYLQQAFSRV